MSCVQPSDPLKRFHEDLKSKWVVKAGLKDQEGERIMGLNELLPKAVRLYPEKEAVVCGNQRMTYGELAARVWRLAHGLLNLGIGQNDRVAVLNDNTHEYLEIYFAAAHLGIVLVPLNYRLSTRELSGILNDSESRVLITKGVFMKK